MAKRISRVERLSRKEETATVKRIISFSIFSIIIAIFLFALGIPILGKFADFLNVIFQKSEQTIPDKSAPLAPRMDDLPAATNSARISISGFSTDATSIEIFLNGEKVGKTTIDGGKFKYEDITLKNGENKIEAKARDDTGNESDFSQFQIVFLDKDEPNLEIDGPNEGQSFFSNSRIKVFGKTESDAQVFANGFLASVDVEGKFEVFLSLVEGENTIEIKAVDTAGNAKTESRKVTYRK